MSEIAAARVPKKVASPNAPKDSLEEFYAGKMTPITALRQMGLFEREGLREMSAKDFFCSREGVMIF